MTNVKDKKRDKEMIEIYRKILGNQYHHFDDEDILLLANRIRWFCHSFINSHSKNFSGKKTNVLPSYQEKNE